MSIDTDTDTEEELSLTDDDTGDTGEVDRGDNFEPALADKPADKPAAGEPTDDLDDEAPAKGHMIPKSRFNEVNEARKTAESQMQELLAQNRALMEMIQRGQAPAPAAEPEPESAEFDYDAKEKLYLEAVMDGDTAAALALRKEINQRLTSDAQDRAMQQMAQGEQEKLFKSTVKEVLAAYPELDSKGKQANTAAITDVVDLRDFYISKRGMPPHEALRKASDAVAKQYGMTAGSAPNNDPAPSPSDARKMESAARNADAANRQPPALGGVGNRGTAGQRMNVETMTEDEFEALPASEKKRLRGD